MKRKYLKIAAEYAGWAISSLIIALPALFELKKGYYHNLFLKHNTEITYTYLIIIFPILFHCIFKLPPVHFLIKSKNKESEPQKLTKSMNGLEILCILLQKSKVENENTYSRAKFYLFSGLIIALLGIFYLTTNYIEAKSISENQSNPSLLLWPNYIPRIGVFLFIEALAFFFLKQHNETIKLYNVALTKEVQRENQFLILTISLQNEIDPLKRIEILNDLKPLLYNFPEMNLKDMKNQ